MSQKFLRALWSFTWCTWCLGTSPEESSIVNDSNTDWSKNCVLSDGEEITKGASDYFLYQVSWRFFMTNTYFLPPHPFFSMHKSCTNALCGCPVLLPFLQCRFSLACCMQSTGWISSITFRRSKCWLKNTACSIENRCNIQNAIVYRKSSSSPSDL